MEIPENGSKCLNSKIVDGIGRHSYVEILSRVKREPAILSTVQLTIAEMRASSGHRMLIYQDLKGRSLEKNEGMHVISKT